MTALELTLRSAPSGCVAFEEPHRTKDPDMHINLSDAHPAVVAGRRFALELHQELDRASARVNQTLRSTRLHLTMSVGQKVSIKDDEIQKPEQHGVVFTIAQVVGAGADAFVSLEAPDGTIAEWFRMDELEPAAATMASLPETEGATLKAEVPPAGKLQTHGDIPTDDAAVHQGAHKLMALADTLAKRRRIPYRDAVLLASRVDPAASALYRAEVSTASSVVEPATTGSVTARSPVDAAERSAAAASEPLLTLASAIAKAKRISLRAGLSEASRRYPQAVEQYRDYFGLL